MSGAAASTKRLNMDNGNGGSATSAGSKCCFAWKRPQLHHEELRHSITPELEEAVKHIQRAARKFLHNKYRLDRLNLISRLRLENTVLHGLRLMILFLLLFNAIQVAQVFEQEKDVGGELGLRQSYVSMFGFDQLQDVSSISELNDWLKGLSRTSRAAQVTSSDYFQEQSEQKLLEGSHYFSDSLRFAVDLWMPFPGFSFTFWVDPPVSGTSRTSGDSRRAVFRKPLESAVEGLPVNGLSCWEFYVERTYSTDQIKFVYGAHDQGYYSLSQQEEVLITEYDRSLTPDGVHSLNTRFIAFVITAEGHQHILTVFLFENIIQRIVLPRPVTDCEGSLLDLGSPGLSLADVTYYPRPLSSADVEDILAFGLPRTSVTRGKSSFITPRTESDQAATERKRGFAVNARGQEELQQLKSFEAMLSRHHFKAVQNPPASVPTFHLQERTEDVVGLIIPAMGPEEDGADIYFDNITGLSYIDIFHAGLMDGHKHDGLFSIPDVPMHCRFWPSDPSFTLSLWMRPDLGTMVDLFFFFNYNLDTGPCWATIWAEEERLMFGGADGTGDMSGQGFTASTRRYILDREQKQLRHLAFVREEINATSLTFRIYVDGEQVVEATWGKTEHWNNCSLMCFPGSLGDVRVGQAPNEGFRGDMQQVRLYPAALTAAQILRLHDESVDPDSGLAVRSCYKLGEIIPGGADSAQTVDVAGHDCSWYFEAKSSFPSLCSYKTIQQQCPWACGVYTTCWTARRTVEYRMSTSIMRLASASHDVSQSAFCSSRPDCSTVCPFDDMGSQALAAEVRESDSWSQSMWVQILPSNTQAVVKILFYSLGSSCSGCFCLATADTHAFADIKIFPTGQVTAAIRLPSAGEWIEIKLQAPAQDVAVGAWLFIGVSMGPLLEASDSQLLPQRHLTLAVNSRSLRIPINSPAEQNSGVYADSADIFTATTGFFDAMYVSGHILLAAVEFHAREIADWEFQSVFYSMRSQMQRRPGPRWTLEEQNLRLSYQVEPFQAPGFIVAPPVMLQKRAYMSESCDTTTSRVALKNIWSTSWKQCGEYIYECPSIPTEQDLAQLISCTDGQAQGSFLGRNVTSSDEGYLFGEFLITATEASLVWRNGVIYQTQDLLTAQTTDIIVLMVLSAPNHGGRVSIARVDASLGTKVSATYSINHFRAIEPGSENMGLYQGAIGIVIFLAVLLFIDSIFRLCGTCVHRKRRRRWRVKKVVFFDFLLAVAVINMASLGLMQQQEASGSLSKYLNRLMDESRWETSEPVEMKFTKFLSDNGDVQNEITLQENYRSAVMVISGLVLGRLIIATQAHPRIAILVDTLSRGADALIHYFLLLVLIFVSFVSMGVLFFGSEHQELSSFKSAVELLVYLMMTAEFPEDTFKSSWGYMLFIVCHIVIFFFFMLNFLLAIIVDMYSKVQYALDVMQTEQFVFVDLWAAFAVFLRRCYYHWPHPKAVIDTLEKMPATRTVTAEALERVCSSWPQTSRFEFVRYYRGYDFLAPTSRTLSDSYVIARRVEERMALLMGVPLPSEYDHARFIQAQAARRRQNGLLKHGSMGSAASASSLLGVSSVPAGDSALSVLPSTQQRQGPSPEPGAVKGQLWQRAKLTFQHV